jgi:hypothetical protein
MSPAIEVNEPPGNRPMLPHPDPLPAELESMEQKPPGITAVDAYIGRPNAMRASPSK